MKTMKINKIFTNAYGYDDAAAHDDFAAL